MSSANNRSNPSSNNDATSSEILGATNTSGTYQKNSQSIQTPSLSMEVINRTASMISKMKLMSEKDQERILKQADQDIEILTDALNCGDTTTIEKMLDRELMFTTRSSERIEKLMIALLQNGYLEFAWSSCEFLVHLQSDRQVVYLREFFHYFEQFYRTIALEEVSEDAALCGIRDGLLDLTRYFLKEEILLSSLETYSILLEVAYLFGESELVGALFQKGIQVGEKKIAFIYAKLLFDSGKREEVVRIADFELSLEQDLHYSQFLLAIALQEGEMNQIESLRQKIVAIFSMKDQEIPKFPFLSQLGYEKGVQDIFQLQEEISGQILTREEIRDITRGIRQFYPDEGASVLGFISEPRNLSSLEQDALQEDLLVLQFKALELCSIEAIQQYITVLRGLYETPQGQNLLHMFFVKFSPSSLLRSIVIETSQEINDLSLPLYIYVQCIHITKVLQQTEDIPLLEEIYALMIYVGDQATIHIDGDVPELEVIRDKIQSLHSYSEAFSQLPIQGQQYFQSIQTRLMEEYGEYGIRKCTALVEAGAIKDDVFSDELILFVGVRGFLLQETSGEFLRCFERIDLGRISPEASGLLGISMLHFKHIFSHSSGTIPAILTQSFFDTKGSTESILGILNYLVALNDSGDEGEKRVANTFIEDFLSEISSENEVIYCENIEQFITLLLKGYPNTPRTRNDLYRILARAKYIDDDFLGSIEYMEHIREKVSEDTRFILQIQSAVQGGYSWSDTMKVYNEWRKTGEISAFREICKLYSKNQYWNGFEEVMTQAFEQKLPFVIEGYIIALSALLDSSEVDKCAETIYSLLDRMHRLPKEQFFLLPDSLRTKLYDWIYQAINGEFSEFSPDTSQHLFIYSIACKGKFSEQGPTEKMVTLYWTLIEKALISRQKEDIDILLSHYERSFSGYLTADPNEPQTIVEFLEAVQEDINEFISILEYETYSFSREFISNWLRTMVIIASDILLNEELTDMLLNKIENLVLLRDKSHPDTLQFDYIGGEFGAYGKGVNGPIANVKVSQSSKYLH